MKKILYIFVVLLLPLHAMAFDYAEEYCFKEPYPIGSKAVDIISNITGVNFITTKAIETSIQKSLKNDLKSSFNVEIYPFSIPDLKSGKFKKITISAPRIESSDLFLTDFKAESVCPYNRIAYKDNKLFFAENFLLGYDAKISNSDLVQTVLSPKYLNAINKIDLRISGLTLFRVHDPNIEIKNNRVYLIFKYTYSNFLTEFTKTLNANCSLKIQDEKIVFSDIKLGSHQGISSNALFYILNALNPFNTKVKIDENNTAEIKTQELHIIDNVISTKGIVIFKKNYIAD